jgi:L-cysteine desulfidase
VQSKGEVKAVSLRCDPRVFKNCFAVGIPNSGGRTGILWAMAIGSLLPDPSLKLECFREADAAILDAASRLMARKAAHALHRSRTASLSLAARGNRHVFDRYNIVDDDDLLEAVEKLEAGRKIELDKAKASGL